MYRVYPNEVSSEIEKTFVGKLSWSIIIIIVVDERRKDVGKKIKKNQERGGRQSGVCGLKLCVCVSVCE